MYVRMYVCRMLRQDQRELRNLTNKTTDAAFIGSILMYGSDLQDTEKAKIEGAMYVCMYVCMCVLSPEV